MHYGQTSDIWSVGCILAEMMTGKVLFMGRNHLNQLHQIMQSCGTPDQTFMKKITCKHALKFLETVPQMERKDLTETLCNMTGKQGRDFDPMAMDLLNQMLQLDPDRRPDASQALAHEFLSEYSDFMDEPVSPVVFDDGLEGRRLDRDGWRNLLWNEIQDFHPVTHL